jgi:hypothetical protein
MQHELPRTFRTVKCRQQNCTTALCRRRGRSLRQRGCCELQGRVVEDVAVADAGVELSEAQNSDL